MQRIPLSQSDSINKLKQAVQVFCKQAEPGQTKEYFLITEFCKADARYVDVTFEHLQKLLPTTPTRSLFQLTFFLFEKSKRMKTLLAPHLATFFDKALSVPSIRAWALDELARLDDQFGASQPALRALRQSKRVAQAHKDQQDDQQRTERTINKQYAFVQRSFPGWLETYAALSGRVTTTLHGILEEYCVGEAATEEALVVQTWGVEVQVPRSASAVIKKYCTNTVVLTQLVDLRKALLDLRLSVWNGYVGMVGVQSVNLDIVSDEEYVRLYQQLVDVLDGCDDLIDRLAGFAV